MCRLDGRESEASVTDRLERVRERYPSATALAYSRDDDPDAAIDASRLGVEYVSGRRLAADGETLADRIARLSARSTEPRTGADDSFLERFVRIVSDRTLELEATLDALLELGRDRLGLSIGYASRTTPERFTVRRQQGGDGLLASLADRGVVDADGSLPIEQTYCKRTVGAADVEPSDETDGSADAAPRDESGVVAFTDPDAAGWEGDPAHELFGLGSYIGGRVVVDGDVFGSLCFADTDPRDRPFTANERLFVELLSDWLGRAFERREAREQREQAVERLENTLERIDGAFFALDEEWRFTYVNERAATLLDRSADELVGANVWDEFSAALGQQYETNYRRAMEQQETVSFEDHYAPLDLWTEVTAYPSPDGLSVFFSDITERRRREQTLERLLETAEQMQRDADAAAVADRLTTAADDILGYGISGVRLFDEDAGVLRLVATSDGVGDRFRDREPRTPGEGIVGSVYESGESAVWTDLTDRTDGREYHGMRSLIGVPLGEHGVFLVGSLDPDAFDESDVSVVELLATNATATLDANRRRERLRTYESALKNVDDMVCVLDTDDTVTYATEAFAAWIGVEETELIGTRLCDALPEPEATRVTEAIAALNGTATGTTEKSAAPVVDLHLGASDGGSRRRGELRFSALSGRSTGVVGSLSDTTDLHRTRTELSRERDRFDRLFERLPDPVMEVSLEPQATIIAEVNPAFESQFGYDASTLTGRTLDALDIHDGRLDRASIDDSAGGQRGEGGDSERGDETSLDRRVRENGFVTAEVHRRTVDGPREFLFRGLAYEAAEGRRAFGIYTDITDRKRREQYVRVVNRILRHNLRNELNVVFGFASEIAGNTDDDRIRDYAERIETTGKRLAAVAEGAAQIRSVVEEGIVTDPDPVPLGPVVEDVRARFAERYPGARIDVEVPDRAAILGDDRFGDALEHLVENAVEHGRSDSPRVAIDARVDAEAGVARVAVRDDGPGIPEDIRAVITGDREVTQLTHNTGIGLWIVAWVVEAYGGELAFGPGIDGEGVTVELTLPAPSEPSATR